MKLEAFGRKLAGVVLARKRLTVFSALLVTAACAAGLARASFSTDYRIFFAPDDPQLVAFQRLERTFTKTDNVLFVVHSKKGDVFSNETLALVQEITERAWQIPHATRVDSLTNFRRSYADGEDLIIEGLVESPAASLANADLDEVRTAAQGEPLLVGSLLSKDLETTGINVTLRLPLEHPDEVVETADAAFSIVDELGAKYPNVEIRASGMALMNYALMNASIRDMSTIVPAMYVVMLLAMLLLLRSRRATAAIVAIVALSCSATLGVAGWLGYPLTPVTASAPTIVLTLAVADGVHVFLGVRSRIARGMAQRAALIESVTVNFRPVLLTSITTMIGFLCLNFAEAPPYWHLANMTAVGILFALVLSLTLLPVMLSGGTIEARTASPVGSRWLDRIGRFTTAAPGWSLVGAAIVTAVFGGFAAQLETNDRFLEYFDESVDFRKNAAFTAEHLSGIYTVELAVDSGTPNGVSDPAYLANLDRFATWLRTQPEADHVYAYSDLLKRLNRDLNGGDPAFERLPDDRALASQYLALYEMSLPFGLDLTDRIDIAKSSSRVSIIVKDLSSQQMQAFKERTEGWLRTNTPEPMHAIATSPVVIFSYLADRNTRAMLRGNIASLVLISLCLIIALASLRLGILSIIPNVLPIVFGYGLWSILYSEINIVASVVGTICLGIIVDDTIHFLTKYQYARRVERLESRAAILATVQSVGPALVVTTLILGLGFGVLTWSGFTMNQYLGLLTVMVVGFALVADLLILPSVLIVLDAPSRDDEVTLSTPELKGTTT